LLSNRIKRDLLLVDTLQAGSSSLEPTSFKIPGGKVKLEEAVKNLAAVIKLYDTVLQSMSQLRNLVIVEEKDGVRAMAEGTEAYFHASR
jgi:signal recognition particle subunit SRP68